MGESSTTSPDFKVTFSGYHPDKYVTTVDQDTNNASDIDLVLFRTGEVLLNYVEAVAEAGTITQADLDLTVNQLRKRGGISKALTLSEANASPDPFLTAAAGGRYQSPVLLSDPNKAVILEIRRERAIELAQEGYRYYDIIRWKEGKVFEAPFYGMYFPGVGVYDVDGNSTNDIEIFETASSSNASSTKKLNDEIFLTNGNSGLVWLHKNIIRNWDENKDYLYPIPTDDRNLTGGALTQNPGWNDGLNF